MGNGVATAGIEYYLPLFFEQTATVFDYLGAGPNATQADAATVVLHGDLEPAFQRFWQDTKDRYRLVQGDPERPVLPPEALFLSAEQFYTLTHGHAQLALRTGTADVVDNTLAQALPELTVVRGAEDPLARLQAHIQGGTTRVLILAESDGRRESLLDFVRSSGLTPPVFDSLEDFLTSDGQVGTQWCTASTALAAIEAWSTWTWARKTKTARLPCKSFCTSNTRAMPRCMFLSASCS